MKVHALPEHLSVKDEKEGIKSFAVERNDSLTRLSEIEAKDGLLYIPRQMFEDALADTPLEDLATAIHKTHVVYEEAYFKEIQRARQYAYRACKWYPSLPPGIPTAKSLLYLPLDVEDARRFIEENLEQYPFVRTCHMSPKDIRKIPLFTDAAEAIDVLLQSERTNNLFSEPFCEGDIEENDSDSENDEAEGKEEKIIGCSKHLFMRERKQYEWEARCFWSHGRLTAVSMDEEMDEQERAAVLRFFARWGRDLPYHSAVVDIGKVPSDHRHSGEEGKEKEEKEKEGERGKDEDVNIELVEFNTFGPDMYATSGHFSWFEDVLDLLFSTEPVFKGPGEWA